VETFIIVLVFAGVIFLMFNMFRNRSKRMKAAAQESRAAAAQGLSISRDLFEAEMGHRAPVEEFHVVGNEARVTFGVPLGESDDEILNDLLADEAIEVLRDRRHTLPIEDVDTVVALAGDPPRELSRRKLHAPGVLPEPLGDVGGLSFRHIAHDPFAAPFEDEGVDHATLYTTRSDAPPDELGPIRAELDIPKGLDRGMRALGTNPDELNGPDFVLSLLRMFGYGVTEQAYEGSYMALKGGVSTYIVTDAYQPGDHPELEERVIRRFLGDFSTSGADRGMLITDKYSPFMIHEIETNQPKVRFVTRERIQRFIDSMSLG